MVKKNIPIGLNPAEEELVKRVDAMMVVPKNGADETSDQTPAVEPVASEVPEATEVQETASDQPAVPPLDIYSSPTTAPEILAASPNSAKKTTIPVFAHDDDNKPQPPTEALKLEPVEETTVPAIAPTTAPTLNDFVSPRETVQPVSSAPLIYQTAEDGSRVAEVQAAGVDVPPLRIDDAATDAAIDAIAAKDSDDLLAAQDAQLTPALTKSGANPKTPVVKTRRSFFKRAWFYIIILLLALVTVAAVPYTRYKVAGLIYKQDLNLTIVDSKTNTPVSGAKITVNGITKTTDASGKVSLAAPVGQQAVEVYKQYYASSNIPLFVGFKQPKPVSVKLVATGRQVPVSVKDMLTGKPVAGAEITVSGTNAKTDKNGLATVVLPTKTQTITGKLTAPAYNSQSVTVQITSNSVPGNTFRLTPAGKVYFLSNQDGTIDVAKANLDGSSRLVVLKGTGKEDVNTTVLLASHDWRYVVLKAQRDGSQAAMYLLDTSNDKLVEFDSGDANFTPIGWSGHSFIYDVVKNNIATTQNGHEAIKSYDAERGQLNQLDDTKAETSGVGFLYQGFYNFSIVGDLVLYNTQWFANNGADLAGKTDSIRGVQYNGQSKKDYQTIPAAGLGYIQAATAKPNNIYYSAYNYADSKTSFYEFADTSVKTTTNVDQASFNKTYPVYVLSPSGKQSLWSELRDGKNTVLLGDSVAGNPRPATGLTGYSAYGWYSDNYILVSKGGSQLYIVASTGTGTPLKITDYYKPPQNFGGGGYGGL